MPTLYIASVWLHVLAAIIWIGGMFFLILIAIPWLRQGERASAAAFLRGTGQRFLRIGWLCFGILLATGVLNLWLRGVRLESFGQSAWLSSSYGKLVQLKLGLFCIIVSISTWHDFFVGPRATRAIASGPGSREAQRHRRRASFLGRANLLLALALVAIGIMLGRGVPW